MSDNAVNYFGQPQMPHSQLRPPTHQTEPQLDYAFQSAAASKTNRGVDYGNSRSSSSSSSSSNTSSRSSQAIKVVLRVSRLPGSDGLHAVSKFAPASGVVFGYYRLTADKTNTIIASCASKGMPYELVDDETQIPTCSAAPVPLPDAKRHYDAGSGPWSAGAGAQILGGAPVHEPPVVPLPAMDDLRMSAQTAFGQQQPSMADC